MNNIIERLRTLERERVSPIEQLQRQIDESRKFKYHVESSPLVIIPRQFAKHAKSILENGSFVVYYTQEVDDWTTIFDTGEVVDRCKVDTAGFNIEKLTGNASGHLVLPAGPTSHNSPVYCPLFNRHLSLSVLPWVDNPYFIGNKP